MSEAKFVVGQWVTRKGVNWKVVEVSTKGDTVILGGYGAAYVHDCFPVEWQVGKTYETTLDGVTVRVTEIDSDGDVVGAPLIGDDYRHWRKRTGKLFGWESDDTKPHLLPYLADEPPPVAEAATFSEFEEVDECDEPDALQSLLTEFSHRREQCQRMAESWETKAAEWRKAEQMIVESIERAKR